MADPSVTRSTRTYILDTLLATLAATALIAMFLVIFSPAQVTFSVTGASCSPFSTDDSMVSLHLSITANSSQRRTEVKFESIFVDLFNSSEFLEREDDWRRRINNAHVDGAPHGYLKFPANTTINVSAATTNCTFADFAPGWLDDDVKLTVMVMAQVHFRVGVVRTRLYGITVYCDDVAFPVVHQRNDSPGSRPAKYMKQEEGPIPDAPQFPVTCHI